MSSLSRHDKFLFHTDIHSIGFWHDLRLQYISGPVFNFFRNTLPKMSTTEKEALEAGSVWWDGDLFSGAPDWNKLIAIKLATLTTEEREFIEGPVNELCSMLDDWQITRQSKDLPESVWQFIKDNRLFGLIIPKTYGGLEYSALAHSAMVMKLASKSITAAVTVMVPNSLGPAKLIMEYGTQQQKDYYLPRLATGEEIPAFALTSPNAGSDASAMTDYGIICREQFNGKNTLGIRLNWEKRYITLGPVCTLLGLAFKLYDPQQLLSKHTKPGITIALVPTNLPGVTIGRRHYPLSQTFQNGPNSGKDVFIPIDWIIGGQEYAGKGWRMLMESLADGRSISLPALSTGAAKLASHAAGSYARIRKQFNRPIGDFGGISEALTRIAGNTYIMNAARNLTISSIDQGEKPSVVSAVVKYHMTEKMRQLVNDAMDIYGGAAICMGPRNILGRIYQAVPISITVEGANILTRSMIIFGQGAVRCHPYVFKEISSANNKNKADGLITFDKAFSAHVLHVIRSFFRTFVTAITDGRFCKTPSQHTGSVSKEYHYATKRYYQKLSRLSTAFALLSDFCMVTLGGKLKQMENISGRLADILSYHYLASAVLKHYHHEQAYEEDKGFMQWSCETLLYDSQQAFDGVLANLPNRTIATMLRLLIFPLGRPYKKPDDQLAHLLAQSMLSPSSTRNRLTSGIYTTNNLSDPLGRINDALTKVIYAEDAEKKLHQLIKSKQIRFNNGSKNTAPSFVEQMNMAHQQDLISGRELKAIYEAHVARNEVIKVDDFDQELN
ncbi:MAG: acyl-CoA dehydrogenase [gamma proteobacterium symbiont of Bathyaustriella thionipta]|nr:acyl-CoA dehydrogenase [gamma proteobacterium symbiont of Bathyaustriella thionipta]MCU7950750.1 acyl-CoA dehydrogenase [gamma proteobacterium symbiont of Bathyaustriella thionipta]MCU7952840.1 acyl-CoA dehydrogenase [gamma proteobacterium symbiont of Bathyaustriella thionipta]MCU7957241.1 acyl-CoA dehydrogenase [gamma proteobacterium symbiont of Bathyaustriella thionipta]MCU7967967.1 acyl-CoA dehydrogenase [gamma proteobacterium symbiont of Bathyaustriella thionipta]